jgi:hypothetical protein
MSQCQRCTSSDLMQVVVKGSDQFRLNYKGKGFSEPMYMPVNDSAVANLLTIDRDEDYLDLTYCTTCGQVQGLWPIP